MDKLYGYFLHYNHFTGLWTLVPRDKTEEYFNRKPGSKFTSNKDVNELIETFTRVVAETEK